MYIYYTVYIFSYGIQQILTIPMLGASPRTTLSMIITSGEIAISYANHHILRNLSLIIMSHSNYHFRAHLHIIYCCVQSVDLIQYPMKYPHHIPMIFPIISAWSNPRCCSSYLTKPRPRSSCRFFSCFSRLLRCPVRRIRVWCCFTQSF